MKIAFLITRFDETGGAQVHVHDLACALDSAGHDVAVVTGSDGPLSQQLRRQGISVSVVPRLVRALQPVRDVAAIRDVRRVLEGLRPDVVSCHSSKAGVVGRLAAKRAQIPALFTAHGWAFTDGVPRAQRVVYGAIEAAMGPLTAQIITVSAHDLELGRRWLPHVRGRMHAILNGMPDIDVSQRARPRTSPPTGVFVGRLNQQKDHGLLLEAMTDVPGARVQMIGGGPARDEVLDLTEALADAQYFVLLSHWEGLPRSIIEAMRAGLPVIASDVGGVSELVEDGRTGLLVPRGDRAAATRALERIVDSPDLRAELGSAGRARYETTFTFDRMLQQTSQRYEAARR